MTIQFSAKKTDKTPTDVIYYLSLWSKNLLKLIENLSRNLQTIQVSKWSQDKVQASYRQIKKSFIQLQCEVVKQKWGSSETEGASD